MKRTVREWVNFFGEEENATFAIQDINGLRARPKDYKPMKEFIAELDDYGYEEWLDSVPVTVYYNNNHRGGTLFNVDIIGKED